MQTSDLFKTEKNKNMVDETKKWFILFARKKSKHTSVRFVYKFEEKDVTAVIPSWIGTFLNI